MNPEALPVSSVGLSSNPALKQRVLALASDLREYVRLRCPAYYPGYGGTLPDITLTPRQFGFSIVFQVDLTFPNGAGLERFMIKMRRQQKHGSFALEDLSERTRALSRAEYGQHVKAYEFFSGRSDGLSVVRPLDFIESHNALVVEHAIGDDLSKLVKAGSPLAAPSLQRCGRWWRLFHHELHNSTDRAWQAEAIDRMIERRMVRLRRIGAPTESLESVREAIRTATRQVPAVPVPVSLVHGDCKLRHVWATADGVQILDFGNTKIRDSWIDPAALVVEFSLYSLWSRRLHSGPKVADMRTLLHAYFDGPPPAAFSLYVVDGMLKKWHRRLRNWGPGAGLTRLRRSLRTAGLDQSLERLYIDRWFTTQIRAWLALAEGRPPTWLQPVVE